MADIKIRHLAGKSCISYKEVARLLNRKPEDVAKGMQNLFLAAPHMKQNFYLAGDDYLMDKDGFMVLTSGIAGKEAFMAKMGVMEAMSCRKDLAIVREQKFLGKNICIYGSFEAPLFRAKDVADWIGHTNSTVMLRIVDKDEMVLNKVYTPGGEQDCWFLTENGLYEVLMQSRKPVAKMFKSKIKEILKSVRKTGAYVDKSVKPLDEGGNIQLVMQQNAQTMAIIQKQTEMMASMGQMMMQTMNTIKEVVESLNKPVLPAPAPAIQEQAEPETVDPLFIESSTQNRLDDIKGKGCMTMKMAAERFNIYVAGSGKPNARAIADILKYGCGINTMATYGRDDEYIVVKAALSTGIAVPCVWLKPAAIEKLEEFITGTGFGKVLFSEKYKVGNKLKNTKAGDVKYWYIRFGKGIRHILGNKDGSYQEMTAA